MALLTKHPVGEQGPSVETEVIVTKQDKYDRKIRVLFLFCVHDDQCVSKFILSQMFPRRSFKATIIVQIGMVASPG